MKKLIGSTVPGFLLMLLCFSFAVAQDAGHVAVTPVAKENENWVKRHRHQAALMDRGGINLLMVGDSITHGWEGAGATVWSSYYQHRRAINLGISGDRTEHVLWRLDDLPLDRIGPKTAVIMIGTNNIGQENPSTAKEAADGVKAIVERLEKAFPEMKQLVLKVFPRDAKPDDAKRKLVDELNSYLPDLLKDKPNVTLLDINAVFLAADGTLPDEVMKDKLHPGTYGYELWAKAMEPTLTQLLGETNPATTPADRMSDEWWKNRHNASVERMNQGNIGLLMIGDSITHGWDGQKPLFDKFFGEFKPINLGFGGDQTQHVLWRLDNLPLDKIQPKVAMVMIGTNNTGNRANTPWMIADGVRAVVERLHKAYPELKIVALNVFPRGEKKDDWLRYRVEQVNRCLSELVATVPNVTVVDINNVFLTEDGTLPKEIMSDFLHPGAKGYELWGEKLAPIIKERF